MVIKVAKMASRRLRLITYAINGMFYAFPSKASARQHDVSLSSAQPLADYRCSTASSSLAPDQDINERAFGHMVDALGITPIVSGPVRAGGKGLKHDLLGGTPQREHHEGLDTLALKAKSLGHAGLVEGMQHATIPSSTEVVAP